MQGKQEDTAMLDRRLTMLLSWSVICLLSACAGTRMEVVPNPNESKYTVVKKCPSATYSGRTDVAAEKGRLDETASQIGTEFLAVMSNVGLFESIAAVKQDQPQKDLNLVGTFKVNHAPNNGEKIWKAILTGCFLCVPAPFTWYNEDLDVTGTLGVFTSGTKVREMKAASKATVSYQVMSEGRQFGLRSDAIAMARTSVYRQLLVQLAEYCSNK